MALRQFIRSSTFLIIAFAAERLSGLVLTVALGRALGPKSLGEYSFVLSIWNLFTIFTYFGQNLILARDVARDHAAAGRMIGTSGIVVLLASAVGGAVMVALPAVLGYDPTVAYGLTITALTILWADSEVSVAEAALVALNETRWIAVCTVGVSAARTIAIVALLASGMDLVAVFAVLGVANIALAVMLWIAVGQVVGFRELRWDRRLARSQLGIALTFIGSTGVGALFQRLDTILVAQLQGFEALGYFSSAYRAVVALQSLAVPILRAAYPQFAIARANSVQALSHMVTEAMRICIMVATPLAIGVITLGPPILLTALGPRFEPSRLALALLAPSIPPGFIYILVTSAMNAANMERQVLIVNAVEALFGIGLFIVLIPRLGIVGAALAFTITTLVTLFLAVIFLRQAGAIHLRPFVQLNFWPFVWMMIAVLGVLLPPTTIRFSWSASSLVFTLCMAGFAIQHWQRIADTVRVIRTTIARRPDRLPQD